MSKSNERSFEEILHDDKAIMDALNRAARRARWEHKQLGIPLAVWRDGRTVLIPPEEIVVDPEPKANADAP